MLIELTDRDTQYYTNNIVHRPKFEVNGGIKLALKKGAKVKETKIFNLFFRFINNKFDGLNTTALMVRPKNSNEEWMILLPEETKRTIDIERSIFQKQFEKLFYQGLLDSEFQNMILEGYKLLTPNERCAQTLIHEYGHILQWRMYDYLGILHKNKKEFIANQYIWLLESGYLENVANRIPNFETLSPEEKVFFTKETLVEDYRINLNYQYFNDIIILPNKYAYRGDFANSNSLWKGMRIMEQMLRPAIEGKIGVYQNKQANSEEELSINAISKRLDVLESKSSWVPGTSKLSEQHISNDLHELGVNTAKFG